MNILKSYNERWVVFKPQLTFLEFMTKLVNTKLLKKLQKVVGKHQQLHKEKIVVNL